MVDRGWIGVDLDGTLAYYESGYAQRNYIGPPVPAMLARVREWLAGGREVRIFTARIAEEDAQLLPMGQTHFRPAAYGAPGQFVRLPGPVVQAVWKWCEDNDLAYLPVTCRKDYSMIELWDDRAVQVVSNTGRTLAEEHKAELAALRGAP